MVTSATPLSAQMVEEALRLVRHVMAEHARMEHETARNRGIPYIYLGELLGVTAHAYSETRLDDVLEQHVRPALEAPLAPNSDPRYAFTSATKVDSVLVLLGTLCTALSLSPITNPGALNNLRTGLGELLGA